MKNLFLFVLEKSVFFCISVAFSCTSFLDVALAQPSQINTSVNKLGLDIFRDISQEAQNETVVSPFSISSALAMTLAGAQGDTYEELRQALNFVQDDQSVAKEIMAISESLSRAKENQAKQEQPASFDWSLANRLFGEQSYSFMPNYLNFVSEFYEAPLEKVSFKTDADGSRLKINEWVENRTNQRIKNLIPVNAVDSSTRLALVNALYLKAAWQDSFKKELTSIQPFHSRKDSTINSPMMNQVGYFGYKEFDGYELISIPYKVSELRFNILLPNSDESLSAVLSKLNAQDFEKYLQLEYPKLNLYLPKFRYSTDSISLRSAFEKLAVKKAFDLPQGSADFGKIAPKLPHDYLFISDIFHKVFVEIDEDGTEAAAATAVVMMAGSAAFKPVVPKEVRVDRPFLFFIQHVPTSTILFLGNVIEPKTPAN